MSGCAVSSECTDAKDELVRVARAARVIRVTWLSLGVVVNGDSGKAIYTVVVVVVSVTTKLLNRMYEYEHYCTKLYGEFT